MDNHEIRPKSRAPAAASERTREDDRHPSRGADATGRVEISDDGATPTQRSDHDRDVPRGTLTDDRIAELRRSLEAGRYDHPEIIASVARRMIECGDL